MIEKDIRTHLLGSTAITDVVRNRIFEGHAKKGVRGAIIIVRDTSSEHFNTLENEVGVKRARVQIDCYDKTGRYAFALAEKVRNRLSGYRGEAGDTTIQGATLENSGPLAEKPENKSDQWIHRYYLDFSIFHTQSTPTHT